MPVLGLLLALSINAPANAQDCKRLSSDYELLGGPFTAAQLEAESIEELRGKLPPEKLLPFGYVNARWLAFRQSLPDGTRLWKYRYTVAGPDRAYAEGGIVALTEQRSLFGLFIRWLT